MAKKKIFILGAGLAGLSAAWHLQKRGSEAVVFEKEKDIGGLCRSKPVNGFIFDYSGHLLHFRNRYAFNLVKRLLGSNLIEHRRSAWVYFNRRYIGYPFQANLHGLPPEVVRECVIGFLRSLNAKHSQCGEINFLDWIKRNLGEGIARHFMVPYNTKFWTVPPQKLTCDWLDNFIPLPDFAQVIRGATGAPGESLGYNERFWYPRKGGIQSLPLEFASGIRHLYTGCPVTGIDLNRKEIRLASGSREKFDWLVSTMPLPEIPSLTCGIPAGILRLFSRLKWNSVVNLNLGIGRKGKSRKHWVYFPQKKISFFRVGFPHNFSAKAVPPQKSSLYAEVAYSSDLPVKKGLLSQRIKDDLKKTGIIAGSSEICCEDTNDIKYAYPIYDRNYRLARQGILDFLRAKKIISCGRYGSWSYMSMEDAIIDGMRPAETIKR